MDEAHDLLLANIDVSVGDRHFERRADVNGAKKKAEQEHAKKRLDSKLATRL